MNTINVDVFDCVYNENVVAISIFLMEGISMRLSNLVNIGPKLELMLNEVGVESAESLRAMGSVEATFLLCEKKSRMCQQVVCC